jgi:hypothetical protein
LEKSQVKYTSFVEKRGQVSFPDFNNERVYMLEFFKKIGLPTHLKHWQKTVDLMLNGIETDLPIYLMIDQAFVKAGQTHRRPGLHIDGYWNAGHTSHQPAKPVPIHGPDRPMHGSGSDNWETAIFNEAEALVLATNVTAARGFEGQFLGPIKHMGACEHISVDGLKEVKLDANFAYVGNVTFLHESLPVEQDCYRTLIRLNLPGFKIK